MNAKSNHLLLVSAASFVSQPFLLLVVKLCIWKSFLLVLFICVTLPLQVWGQTSSDSNLPTLLAQSVPQQQGGREARIVLQGEIFNATTGKKTKVRRLTLLELSQQMNAVETILEAGPIFRFEDILYRGTPLLLQAEFQGGTYNKLLPPGQNLQEMQQISVYEAGAPKNEIRISALMWITKLKEKTVIENVFLVENKSQPPRAYDLGQEKFFVSADANRDSLRATVKRKSMPIPLQLQCSGSKKEICTVSRQLPPGLNEFRVSYEVSGHQFVDRLITDLQSDLPEKMVFYKPLATRPVITSQAEKQSADIQDLDLKILGQALRVPYLPSSYEGGGAATSMGVGGGLVYNMEKGPYLIENLLAAHENPVFTSYFQTTLGILLFFSLILFLGSLIVRPLVRARGKVK